MSPPIYCISHYELKDYSRRSFYKTLAFPKHLIDKFVTEIEAYIADYYAIISSSTDIPRPEETLLKLLDTTDNINQVIDDLDNLPAFGVPLLKAKLSMSGKGFLPDVLNQIRSELTGLREAINWAANNIQGDTTQTKHNRLKKLLFNIACPSPLNLIQCE